MDDAAVVSRLVGGDVIFLLDDEMRIAGNRRVASRAVASPTIPAPMINRVCYFTIGHEVYGVRLTRDYTSQCWSPLGRASQSLRRCL